MNFTPAHIDALQAFDDTEQEARFLYIVATHSGYFVVRQFLVEIVREALLLCAWRRRSGAHADRV